MSVTRRLDPSSCEMSKVEKPPDRDMVALWGRFLASVAVPVLVALVLFAASYFLEVLASRLDMDMVLNAEEALDGPNPA